MRLYIHLENTALGPPHTKKISTKDDAATAASALAMFVESYCSEHGAGSLKTGAVDLQDAEGATLDLSAPLASVAKEKDDLYVVPSKAPKVAAPPAAPKPAAAKPAAPKSSPAAQPPKAAERAAAAEAPSSAVADKCAAQASELMSKGRVRDARQVLERGLDLGPHAGCMAGLGECATKVGKHAVAATWYEKAAAALKAANGAGAALAESRALVNAGAARMASGDDGAALAALKRAVALLGPVSGKDAAAVAVDAHVAMSQLLLRAGRGQDAADLVVRALSPPEHADHVEGHVTYAMIAEQHGKDAEALSVLLRLVVTKQDERKPRKLLAKVLSKAGGATSDEVSFGGGYALKLLLQTVPLSPDAASAYAFLATCVKEHGAIDAACGLLHLAKTAKPDNHS